MRRGSRTGVAAWKRPVGEILRRSSILAMAAAVGVSPLLVGSVHRPAVIVLLVVSAVALSCAVVGENLRESAIRGQQFSLFFLVLLLLPLTQLVPWPVSWRAAVDPAGLALLENGPHGAPRSWPLSLDPVATLDEIATAAAALVAFVLALHGATSRRRRTAVLNAIAFAGVVAVVIGIGHRIFGIDRLWGVFTVSGSVLPGPFINANHAAEFYELAAFCALALAKDAEREARIGWYAAAGVEAAAALTTLSRGSVLALLAGGATFVVLRLRADPSGVDQPVTNRFGRARRIVLTSLLALGCLGAIAFALGAAPVLDEVARTNFVNGTEKIIVWRDSLPMIWRHPLGIGRHAFEHVFPAYKTLSLDSRFQFVENGPLQLLIDLGWPGFLALLLSLGYVLFKTPRRGDSMGAALVAALVAVGAHNLVDFGLETPGIRLPFAAIAGVVIGRIYGRNAPTREPIAARPHDARIGLLVGASATVGILVGLWGQFQKSSDQVEEQWKAARTSEDRRQLAVKGGERFPTDYFFPLLQSYDEPLRTVGPGGAASSPRLAALNRAMRLCPTCSFPHEKAARALRQLGLRSQSLSSFRDAVRLAPPRLMPVLLELDHENFTPAELASLAVGDGDDTLRVAQYLVPKKAEVEVGELIARARQQGVPAADLLLVQADLSLALGRHGQVRSALAELRRQAPRDSRSYAALATLEEQEGHIELALEQARLATTMSPFAVALARRRLELVLRLQKWTELDEALERLKEALRQSGQNVTEVHMVAGQTHQSRGNLGRAVSEFRTASTLDGNNPAIWAALGRVSEERGDLSGAAAAYQRGASIRPDDVEFTKAIARIERERSAARLKQLLP